MRNCVQVWCQHSPQLPAPNLYANRTKLGVHRKKTTKPTVNSLRAWACSPLPDCVLFLHFQGVQLLPSIKRCGNRPISSLPCLLRHPLSGYLGLLLVRAFTVSLHFPVSIVGWSKSLPNRLSESQDITQPWRCIV